MSGKRLIAESSVHSFVSRIQISFFAVCSSYPSLKKPHDVCILAFYPFKIRFLLTSDVKRQGSREKQSALHVNQNFGTRNFPSRICLFSYARFYNFYCRRKKSLFLEMKNKILRNCVSLKLKILLPTNTLNLFFFFF